MAKTKRAGELYGAIQAKQAQENVDGEDEEECETEVELELRPKSREKEMDKDTPSPVSSRESPDVVPTPPQRVRSRPAEMRSCPRRLQITCSPRTPSERVEIQTPRTIAKTGKHFWDQLRAPPTKPGPPLENPFKDQRATNEALLERRLIPFSQRAVAPFNYGFETNPARQAARKSIAPIVAIDLGESRGGKRGTKRQDSFITPTKTKRVKNNQLHITNAPPVRDITDESSASRTRSTPRAKSTGKLHTSTRVTVGSPSEAIAKRRKQAQHKNEPKVRFVWPASQPPPKLFALPRTLRTLGEANISARQKHKTDDSFNPDVNPWTHRFERKINRTDGGATSSAKKQAPTKEIDERLVAMPKTPKKSDSTHAVAGSDRAHGRTDPGANRRGGGLRMGMGALANGRSAHADLSSYTDLGDLYRDENNIASNTSVPARAPVHTPAPTPSFLNPPEHLKWRQKSVAENIKKAKRDPFEGLE
ncbi:MAG: hypothetical protein M1816_001903 [Peltula sp. TS41687]|nr:MAG: hypothetical protein M1816_001903 [Peltula sp. TS41687]